MMSTNRSDGYSSQQQPRLYTDKLKDPKWAAKCAHILKRDNYTCVHCGYDDRRLHVYHVIYRRRDPWDYPDDHYETICDECVRARKDVIELLVDKFRLDLMKVKTPDLVKLGSEMISRNGGGR